MYDGTGIWKAGTCVWNNKWNVSRFWGEKLLTFRMVASEMEGYQWVYQRIAENWFVEIYVMELKF